MTQSIAVSYIQLPYLPLFFTECYFRGTPNHLKEYWVWIYPGYPGTRARAPRETDGLIRTNQPLAAGYMEDPIRTLTVSQQVTSLTPLRSKKITTKCQRVWGASLFLVSTGLTPREGPEPHNCGEPSQKNRDFLPLRGTPILPVQRAETLLGGGCHPRTTCMTIKDGPTHTRRLGSKTPRCPFTGAQDPMHIFFFYTVFFLAFTILDPRKGASRPRCCLLEARYRPAKDSNPCCIRCLR